MISRRVLVRHPRRIDREGVGGVGVGGRPAELRPVTAPVGALGGEASHERPVAGHPQLLPLRVVEVGPGERVVLGGGACREPETPGAVQRDAGGVRARVPGAGRQGPASRRTVLVVRELPGPAGVVRCVVRPVGGPCGRCGRHGVRCVRRGAGHWSSCCGRRAWRGGSVQRTMRGGTAQPDGEDRATAAGKPSVRPRVSGRPWTANGLSFTIGAGSPVRCMGIEQLEHIAAVTRLGSLHRAAEELPLSQRSPRPPATCTNSSYDAQPRTAAQGRTELTPPRPTPCLFTPPPTPPPARPPDRPWPDPRAPTARLPCDTATSGRPARSATGPRRPRPSSGYG